MSAGQPRYCHIIPVEIGDVIKQSCRCNQFATPIGAGWGSALSVPMGILAVVPGGSCIALPVRAPSSKPTAHTLAHGKRVPTELLVWAVGALSEGLGIRAVVRVFEVDPHTV